MFAINLAIGYQLPLYNERILLEETKNIIISESLPVVPSFTLNDIFNSQIEGRLSTLNIPVVEHIKDDLSYLYILNINDKSQNLPYPVIFDPLDFASSFIESKLNKSCVEYLTCIPEFNM